MKISIYQNMWNTTKSVLNWKCMALNVYISKEGRSQINNLNFYQKKLEEVEQKSK